MRSREPALRRPGLRRGEPGRLLPLVEISVPFPKERITRDDAALIQVIRAGRDLSARTFDFGPQHRATALVRPQGGVDDRAALPWLLTLHQFLAAPPSPISGGAMVSPA